MTLAIYAGLDRVSNGELIKAAEDRGFDALVTADRNLRYQQNLSNRKIAIVVLPFGRWPFQPQIQEVFEAVDGAKPGSYFEIPRKPGWKSAMPRV